MKEIERKEVCWQDEEMGLVVAKLQKRAKSMVFRVRSGNVYVLVPPGVKIDEVQRALQSLRGKLLPMLQHTRPRIIDWQYRIETDLFRLSLQKSNCRKFMVNVSSDEVQILAPIDTQFDNPDLQRGLRKVIEEALRKRAKSVLSSRLQSLSKRCELPYAQVKINASKGRWGSCSAKRNINLSLYLLLLPVHLVDYVLLHELCHTREMNHSAAFWRLLNSFTNQQALVLRRELHRYRPEL